MKPLTFKDNIIDFSYNKNQLKFNLKLIYEVTYKLKEAEELKEKVNYFDVLIPFYIDLDFKLFLIEKDFKPYRIEMNKEKFKIDAIEDTIFSTIQTIQYDQNKILKKRVKQNLDKGTKIYKFNAKAIFIYEDIKNLAQEIYSKLEL